MSIEFKVVSTPRPDRFEETVTNLLNSGWLLQGTPFVSQTGGMTQALTRNVTTPKIAPVGKSLPTKDKKSEN
jgi:hypothetical protein|tara:strand:- start:1030 stop:1245 length:216 start_codon:yes stop_codon:yes gene_type:complete